MDDFTKMLSEKVDELRKGGHSMESIADMAGVTRVYLYKLIKGDSAISLTVADDVAENLGFKISVN